MWFHTVTRLHVNLYRWILAVIFSARPIHVLYTAILLRAFFAQGVVSVQVRAGFDPKSKKSYKEILYRDFSESPSKPALTCTVLYTAIHCVLISPQPRLRPL